MIKHGKNVPPTLGRTVKEASAICRSFLDGVVIFFEKILEYNSSFSLQLGWCTHRKFHQKKSFLIPALGYLHYGNLLSLFYISNAGCVHN